MEKPGPPKQRLEHWPAPNGKGRIAFTLPVWSSTCNPIREATYTRPAVSHFNPSLQEFSAVSGTCNQPNRCLFVSFPSGCMLYAHTQCEADSVTYKPVWSGVRVSPFANLSPSSTTDLLPSSFTRYNKLGANCPLGEVR